MKKLFQKLLPLILFGLVFSGGVAATTVLFPYQGGTGTGTAPSKGTVLSGTSGGIYNTLPVGTNGKVLTADSTQTVGLSWQDSPVSSVSNTDGSLIFSPTTGAVIGSIDTTHSNVFSAGQIVTVGAYSARLGLGRAIRAINPLGNIVDLGDSTNAITVGSGNINFAAFTPSRALIINSSNNVDVSEVTDTELGYVSGVTSNIQVQLDGKQAALTFPLSGTNGGTGVNNGSSTITIGGNTAFSGAFTFTGTLTGNTGVTFPTSGILSTTTGTVTSVSVTTANGVSGSVATSTTTPAITLTLGAITPTTVNGLTITANGTNTINITAGKTFRINNTITFAGTDGTLMTFPAVSDTVAALGTIQTFTKAQSITADAIGTIPLTINRFSDSQTGDMTDWVSGTSGNVLAKVTADGWFQNTQGRAYVKTAVTNATATMTSLTDLSVTLVTGKFYSGYLMVFANDSTAVDGMQFDFGGGTVAINAADFEAGFVGTPVGTTLGTSTTTTLTGAITATTATTGDAAYYVPFAIKVKTGGSFIPRFAQVSHTTGTATIQKNGFLFIENTP